jgi:hypothetical protein
MSDEVKGWVIAAVIVGALSVIAIYVNPDGWLKLFKILLIVCGAIGILLGITEKKGNGDSFIALCVFASIVVAAGLSTVLLFLFSANGDTPVHYHP